MMKSAGVHLDGPEGVSMTSLLCLYLTLSSIFLTPPVILSQSH